MSWVNILKKGAEIFGKSSIAAAGVEAGTDLYDAVKNALTDDEDCESEKDLEKEDDEEKEDCKPKEDIDIKSKEEDKPEKNVDTDNDQPEEDIDADEDDLYYASTQI